MQHIKKILTLQLLAVLLFSQIGYYCFYSIKQHQIKKEIKQQLLSTFPDNSLQMFNANNNNIVWEEEEKEFSIDGKMYDVVKTKTTNGATYLYCLSDEQETTLLNNFAKNIENKKENKQQKENKNSIKLQTISFQNIEALYTAILVLNNKIKFQTFQQHSIAAIVSINIPPPKV